MSFKDPAHTDWEAMGLPDHSPFDILSRPRAVPNPAARSPKKRGPKPSRTNREKTLAALRSRGEESV